MEKILCRRLEKWDAYIRENCTYNEEIYNNYYFISEKIRCAKKQIRIGFKKNIHRVDNISEILKRYEYSLSEREFYAEIRHIKLTDDELENLYSLLIYCCIRELVGICRKRNTDTLDVKVISFMRKSEFFDYKRFFSSLSESEKLLLKYRDYDISDEKTKAQYRYHLKKYAARKGLTAHEALKELSGRDITDTLLRDPHPIAKALYFPIIITVFLFFAVCLFCIALIPFSAFALIPYVLTLFPLYECSVYLVNYSYSKLFVPQTKPSLKAEELDENIKCAVVITSLLDGEDSELFAKLEKYYLSNRRKNLVYGILADLSDSDTLTGEKDEKILDFAKREIEMLCKKYGGGFFLFYREREYSASEGKFIAPERKRGAVYELCKLLNGHKSKIITYSDENKEILYGTKYLITLDSDTILPPGEAERMMRCAEHPANIPVYDEEKHRVVSGHGILQPAVETSLTSSFKNCFSLLTSGGVGVQVYRYARFDIYEEIFNEGIFCGKGIINTAVFCKATKEMFPEEKILSHDIPEGCLTNSGMIPDMTLYDSTPSNAISYYKRQNRWIRGDIQTLFAFGGKYIKRKDVKAKNPLTPFDKYKLYDNVRRDMTPLFALMSMIASVFFKRYICIACAVFSLFYIIIPFLVSSFECIVSGAFGIKRKFYSFTLSSFWYGFLAFLNHLASLTQEAYTALRAVITAVWRYKISGVHLLEWMSATSAEKMSVRGILSYLLFGLFSLVVGVLFLFVNYGIYHFTGLLFILYPFVMYTLTKHRTKAKKGIREQDKEKVKEYVSDMWRYFADNVNEKSCFLPPDNISFVSGKVIAERTSPTNIGLYLTSLLAVYYFEIIDDEELYDRCEKTLSTIEKLRKYKGNLYNWYDTVTCSTLDGFVSFVDSGNFLCCLVCLKEGIKKLSFMLPILPRVERLIDETDLSCMFDKERNMFYIGLDEHCGVTRQNHYDIYMSEARSADYYATAKGITEPGILSSTARVLVSKSGHIGLASWSGTAFEYFMPTLFLPVPENSLLYEALNFACLAQMSYKASSKGGVGVYGTSESCYFEFDTEMNYQYKAHGVPLLGLKTGLSDDLVISPYSSFLMLTMGAFPLLNLEKLKQYGTYGMYGFYEAVDFTKSRVGDGYAVIKCFMAHHIGMSILASANFVFDDIFVKRFTSDEYVKSSLCLLSEKIPTDTPPYRSQKIYEKPQLPSYRNVRSENVPSVGVISNSLLRCDVMKNGKVSLHFGNIMMWDDDSGSLTLDVFKNGKKYNLFGTNIGVCDGSSAEFAVGNGEKYIASAKLTVSSEGNVFSAECAAIEDSLSIVSFSPVCSSYSEYSAHKSYSRLFITAKIKDGILILKKRLHQKRGDVYFAVAVGDGEKISPFEYDVSADNVMPNDKSEIIYKELLTSKIDTDYICPVTPFVIIKTEMTHFFLLISLGMSEQRVIDDIKSASAQGSLSQKNKNGIKKLYLSQLHCAYSDESIVSALLNRRAFESARKVKSHNGIESLWKYGISGDNPILTLDLTDEFILKTPPEKLLKVIYTHRTLLIKGHRYDTVILYREEDKYHRNVKKRLYEIFKMAGVLPLVGRRYGIFAVECASEEERMLFSDMSFYPEREEKNVLPGVRVMKKHESDRAYEVSNDGVSITNGKGVLPWSFVYASDTFGTLLTQNSLGFTWHENCRMGKLTNFENDVLNIKCEEIFLHTNGRLYGLTEWAEKTKFGFYEAKYTGNINGILYEICVIIDEKNERKLVRVTLTNYKTSSVYCELAYKADFVLGEKTSKNGRLFARKSESALRVVNAYSDDVGDCVLYSPSGKISAFDGVSGSVRCPVKIPPMSSCVVNFSLSVGEEMPIQYNKALALCKESIDAYLNVFELDTKDSDFDVMFNRFSKYQALYCRVYARCGFYQNGGAYGFRDQLQDMICVMYSSAETAREHILLCASHQYEEGDVTHWWHTGKTEKGIRTRCSDDMLWLIYVTARYIRLTGDDSVLFTPIGYLKSSPLSENEKDRYEILQRSDIKESLYMHCVRAVETVKYSERGLPLFGSGDWNDGMDSVGGESVWLSWFLYGVLLDMAYLADKICDKEGKEKYSLMAHRLYENIENFAFNGKYYIRGTYSDGSVLGSVGGCDIDILPQAFAAMNGANEKRVHSALNTVWERLYDEKNKQLLLFTPPFDEKSKYAGYICDYPAGIRENGGQYTHGAVWGAIGFFKGGMYERGYQILRALNPLIRCENDELYRKYKGEPYVFAGDVYSNDYTPARCGWSWYTGAAGWYFTAVLEELLGYKETEYGFTLNPKTDKAFTLKIRKKGTAYTIHSNEISEGIYPFDGEDHTNN